MSERATLPLTPSQTVGPYFSMRLSRARQNVVVGPELGGDRVRIEGAVFDGDGKPVEDALIELWQADARGHYPHPADPQPAPASFTGFGRAATEHATGAYWFETIRPGRVAAEGSVPQAPHVSLIVHARGLLRALHTRMYFADDDALLPDDPVLRAVPAARRGTLVARPRVSNTGARIYQFDIRLQGAGETVFFAF
ncbi:MAG: protocatechuate 3,4-dioxygenase subunit alpha [Polyangiales bacterium]